MPQLASARRIVVFAPEDAHALEVASLMDVFHEANVQADLTTPYLEPWRRRGKSPSGAHPGFGSFRTFRSTTRRPKRTR